MEAGAETSPHSHSAEAVMVVLRGRGEARRIGVETLTFEAPCSITLPEFEIHQIANTGGDILELLVAIPTSSKVYDEHGIEMALPWRE
jgi:gentisate 1,2-dioxygenase